MLFTEVQNNMEEKCVPECAYREKVTELQNENEYLRALLFTAASWMGTDDPDWDEVRYVEEEVEKLKK